MSTNTLQIPVSRMKMLKYTAICLLVLLLCVYMFVDSRSEQGGMYYFGQVFGLLGILLFGPLLIICLLLLVRRSKGLVFASAGFQDDSFLGFGRLVLWSEVEEVEQVVLHGHKFIKVRLKNPQEFVAGFSGLLKYIYQINYKYYGTPLFISSLLLRTNIHKLYEQVHFQWCTTKWDGGQNHLSEATAEGHGSG